MDDERTIYLAGPVVNERDSEGVAALYEQLAKTATMYGWVCRKPLRTKELDTLEASAFTQQIAERIRHAAHIVYFWQPGDDSGPVEATLASIMRKPFDIVVVGRGVVPRIIRGLPGFGGAYRVSEIKELVARIGGGSKALL